MHCKNKGSNIVATSFDSETEVCKKYPNAKSCIQSIKQSCGRVLHGVDGTKLEECAELNQLFDYVIFNFPHSGQQRVHINRNLLLAFFTSAKCKVVFSGQIHVTLKTRPPYSNWNMEQLATEAGLVLKHICAFRPNKFPGYRHRTTDPQAKVFDPNHCKSYVFIVDRSKVMFNCKCRCCYNFNSFRCRSWKVKRMNRS